MSVAAVGLISYSARFAFGQKDRLKDSHGNYQIPAQAAGDPVFHFTRATFEPYLQSDFRVTVGPFRTVQLTLVEVIDQRPRVRKGMARTEGESFLLMFRANGKLSDLQQTYVLEHGALGKFSLFLVDAGKKGNDTCYSAVINHTRPAQGSMKE
ncbi:MAG TPA: hypothetical protein VF527_09540 [Pyrinomonadaceae bacterium]